MGLLTFIGRVILVVLNIIFIIVSLLLVALGFVLRFANDLLKTYVQDALDAVKNAAQTVYSKADFDTNNLDLASLFLGLAIVLIVVGMFLLIMSFIGCCGSCYNITTLMLVYAIILIVMLLAQVAVVVLLYGAPDVLKDNIKRGMEASLNDYNGVKGENFQSVAWSFAMQQFDCCGPTNYQDFQGKGNWRNNDEISSILLITPVACCKELPSDAAGIRACAGDTTASSGFETIQSIAAKSNYDASCVEKLWDAVVQVNMPYALTVVGICFACQLALIIFALLIYKDRGVEGGLV